MCVVGGNFVFRVPSSVPTTEHGEKAVALSSRGRLDRPVEQSGRQDAPTEPLFVTSGGLRFSAASRQCRG